MNKKTFMRFPDDPVLRGVEILRSQATYRTSRRNFVRGVALLGSLAVTGLTAPRKASADPGGVPNCPPNSNNPRCQCFLSGTRILTTNGPVEVETLRIGDRVTTISGDAKPIKWIGRRTLRRGVDQSWPSAVIPVKVSKSAFGQNVPSADLYLSQAHMLYLEGVLIPVDNLRNGGNIAVCDASSFDVIDYYHIELAAHDVIFAEGLPVETMLAAESLAYDNWSERARLYPEPLAVERIPFAPIQAYNGHRGELRSLFRSTLSPWFDRRQTLDVVRDRLAEGVPVIAGSVRIGPGQRTERINEAAH
jgi:Hint domain